VREYTCIYCYLLWSCVWYILVCTHWVCVCAHTCTRLCVNQQAGSDEEALANAESKFSDLLITEMVRIYDFFDIKIGSCLYVFVFLCMIVCDVLHGAAEEKIGMVFSWSMCWTEAPPLPRATRSPGKIGRSTHYKFHKSADQRVVIIHITNPWIRRYLKDRCLSGGLRRDLRAYKRSSNIIDLLRLKFLGPETEGKWCPKEGLGTRGGSGPLPRARRQGGQGNVLYLTKKFRKWHTHYLAFAVYIHIYSYMYITLN